MILFPYTSIRYTIHNISRTWLHSLKKLQAYVQMILELIHSEYLLYEPFVLPGPEIESLLYVKTVVSSGLTSVFVFLCCISLLPYENIGDLRESCSVSGSKFYKGLRKGAQKIKLNICSM